MDTGMAAGGPAAACDIDALLAEVNSEIAGFEAKKLSQLKSELEGFVKKKTALIDGYTAKYEALLMQWTEQNTCIERMHKTLACRFEDWSDSYQECVCSRKNDLDTLQDELDIRLGCGKGLLEKARDAAKQSALDAEAYLKAISDNEKGVTAALALNKTWIDEISRLLNCPGSREAIYVFWGKLLPAHKQLANAPLSNDLETSLTAAQCTPPTPVDPAAPHAVPWLVKPTDYGARLDEAWCAYKAAKQAYGVAEATFAGKPDDVASIAKAIEADRKSLDARVRECLKKIDAEPAVPPTRPVFPDPRQQPDGSQSTDPTHAAGGPADVITTSS